MHDEWLSMDWISFPSFLRGDITMLIHSLAYSPCLFSLSMIMLFEGTYNLFSSPGTLQKKKKKKGILASW